METIAIECDAETKKILENGAASYGISLSEYMIKRAMPASAELQKIDNALRLNSMRKEANKLTGRVGELLFKKPFKVRVVSDEESLFVQNLLFSAGAGFHNGTKLIQKLETDLDVRGIFVSNTGMITITTADERDESFFHESNRPELSVEELTSAFNAR
jgi:hypothetical protein